MDRPPGSGRYYVADHFPARRIVLERNPHYGGGRAAYPDRIVWTIEADPDKRLQETRRGANDYMHLFGFFPDALMRELVGEYGINEPGGRLFRSFPTSSNFVFMFNPAGPVFGEARQAALRKAINYVLDRPALIRAHDYLAVRRTDRLLPATLSESRPHYPLDGSDPVTAQRWLARAGRRPASLKLYAATYPFNVAGAQVLEANLGQLGIELDPDYFPLPTLTTKLDTPGEPWDVAWRPWGAPYPDPAAALIPLLRGPRWEARLHAANRVVDDAARAKAWADLEADLMRDDPPVAAYANFRPLILVSPSFGCTFPWADVDLGAVCVK
jgi:ABC-type transport system substrate-binding protein